MFFLYKKSHNIYNFVKTSNNIIILNNLENSEQKVCKCSESC